jgi:hypothetical protein
MTLAASKPATTAPRDQAEAFPWFVLAPLLAVPAVWNEPERLALLVFLSIGLLMVAGMSNPIWVMCGLLLSELTLRNGYIPLVDVAVSNRLFFSTLAFLILLPHLPNERFFDRRARHLLLSVLTFFVVTNAANAATSGAASSIDFLRFLATGLLFFLLIPLFVRRREDVLRFVGFGIVVASIAAVAAITQRLGSAGLPQIRLDARADEWIGRSSGLNENPLYISNDLLLLIFVPIAVLLLGVASYPLKRLALVVVPLMLVGLYFSETRSWVLAFAPAVLVMSLFLEGKMRRDLLLVMAVACIAVGYLALAGSGRYTQGPAQDDSAASRPVLWSASYLIARDNLILGIGYANFLEMSPEYSRLLPQGLLEQQGAGRALGVFAPHHDFLNVWMSFGTFSLIAYCLIFVFTFANYAYAFRRLAEDPLLRAVALGGIGALVAYTVNSSFHNFLDSTWTIWFLAGLSISLVALTAPSRIEQQEGRMDA